MFRKNKMVCVGREMVAADFHDPYITSGYRQPGMDIRTCLKTIFLPYCNETFNVWSHFLFGVYFINNFYSVISEVSEGHTPQHFVWPLGKRLLQKNFSESCHSIAIIKPINALFHPISPPQKIIGPGRRAGLSGLFVKYSNACFLNKLRDFHRSGEILCRFCRSRVEKIPVILVIS